MKGVRFYLEYPNVLEKNKATRKNLGNHLGTVVAVYTDTGHDTYSYTDRHGNARYQWVYNGIGGVYDEPNSPVALTAVSMEYYVRVLCKRISEQMAREIHPRLFEYLED